MELKKCAICKKIIDFGNAKRIYCSNGCRERASRLKRGIAKSRDKVCAYCKKNFVDNSANNTRVYCCKTCVIRIESIKYKKRRNEYSNNYNKGYYEKNKVELIEKQKLYIARVKNTIRHKKMRRKATARDRLKFPKKYKAREELRDYKEQYPELYPKECCICGCADDIEYHHPDYNFSLSVYPMCVKHHKELHNAGGVKS